MVKVWAHKILNIFEGIFTDLRSRSLFGQSRSDSGDFFLFPLAALPKYRYFQDEKVLDLLSYLQKNVTGSGPLISVGPNSLHSTTSFRQSVFLRLARFPRLAEPLEPCS